MVSFPRAVATHKPSSLHCAKNGFNTAVGTQETQAGVNRETFGGGAREFVTNSATSFTSGQHMSLRDWLCLSGSFQVVGRQDDTSDANVIRSSCIYDCVKKEQKHRNQHLIETLEETGRQAYQRKR